MAYTTGTAANYTDLLSIIATFAAANNHVILEQSASAIYMKGLGNAGLDEIYWGISLYANPASSVYNFKLYGSIAYRSGRAYGDMPNSSARQGVVYVRLWNAPITYWLIADGRHIKGVFRVGTVYQAFYMGLGNPPATDAQYPYSLIVGGVGWGQDDNYAATGIDNAMFFGRDICTGDGQWSGLVLSPGGLWFQVTNGSNHGETAAPQWVSHQERGSVLTALDGTYMLDEIYLAGNSYHSGWYLLCRVEGIYNVTGYNTTSENIISVSGVNYLVFQDVYRVGYGNYFAMRLV